MGLFNNKKECNCNKDNSLDDVSNISISKSLKSLHSCKNKCIVRTHDLNYVGLISQVNKDHIWLFAEGMENINHVLIKYDSIISIEVFNI